MGHPAGNDHKKADKSLCLVRDCHRKALYKNAMSARAGKVRGVKDRGYCRVHYRKAISTANSDDYYGLLSDFISERSK